MYDFALNKEKGFFKKFLKGCSHAKHDNVLKFIKSKFTVTELSKQKSSSGRYLKSEFVLTIDGKDYVIKDYEDKLKVFHPRMVKINSKN